MQSLEERASEIVAALRPENLLAGRIVLRHLREACRDQRHACAAAVSSLSGTSLSLEALDEAHAVVMNTPEPGK